MQLAQAQTGPRLNTVNHTAWLQGHTAVLISTARQLAFSAAEMRKAPPRSAFARLGALTEARCRVTSFPLPVFEGLVGAALAGLTLLDVFDTVVVPGATRNPLRIAQRVRLLSLPLWRRRASSLDGAPRIARGLAAFILTSTFALWMALLLLGYGLIDDALKDSFHPAIRSLPEAIYTAGLGLVTTGMSGRDADGMARWVVLISGVSGLAVMTMAVTYILEVQNGLQQRDPALAKLSTTAGRPPSGIALLETYAALGSCSELGPLFREWRDWSADVLHSHSSNPVLAYFRSISAEMDWPLALGVVLDAASLYAAFVGGDETGPAMLLHRDGSRLTTSLARLFSVERALGILSERRCFAVLRGGWRRPATRSHVHMERTTASLHSDGTTTDA